SPEKLFRPQLGFNTGLINYFGDVGSLDGLSKQSQMNWGNSLSLVSPLNDAFSLRAFAFFGHITQEERIEKGNANFSTNIRMGGLSFSYNFDHLLPDERNIEPYVSVGISTFEFNSKADLKDANGQSYHYWSDGTIRSIEENAPNKNDANIIVRDYSYETVIRASNENSGLPYAMRGITMPIGAGANLKINDFFTLNMGTEFHLSFTDNIDNISEQPNGRAGNDHFMFSSIGILYNLHHEKRSPLQKNADFEFNDIEFEDEDTDGIADIIDLCPFTEEGVSINEYGCPIDTDKDGVPDYLDGELTTPEGNLVDLEGVTLTDAAIQNIYLTYKDSIGNLSYQKSQTETADYERNSVRMRNRSKGYRVRITETDELDGLAISKLLSISDIRGGEDENGLNYFIGDFNSLEEAHSRMRQLQEMNFSTDLVFNEFGKYTTVGEEEIALFEKSTESFYSNPDQTTFRVQIGAYRYRLSDNIFKEIDNVLVVTGQDGLTRYVSGSFASIKEAAEHRIELLLEGFEGSFVTAYKGGKRISLKEAGARVSKNEKIHDTPETGGINAEYVDYSVQLGAYTGRVPADMLGKFIELDDVSPMRGSNGTTTYIYKSFEDKAKAEEALSQLKSKGFEDAKLIGLFNGKIISEEEATRLKND
ncbi:MAG: SPOR domain-containing protein, partial [Cryomorphaceae bacterium]